ncbi:MAG: hypothetical protein E2O84_03035 [Bacteroidetes bacterium]|nr:MAG: hypothetical protein E2O84_03035 [Bacteroidota bacterium]
MSTNRAKKGTCALHRPHVESLEFDRILRDEYYFPRRPDRVDRLPDDLLLEERLLPEERVPDDRLPDDDRTFPEDLDGADRFGVDRVDVVLVGADRVRLLDVARLVDAPRDEFPDDLTWRVEFPDDLTWRVVVPDDLTWRVEVPDDRMFRVGFVPDVRTFLVGFVADVRTFLARLETTLDEAPELHLVDERSGDVSSPDEGRVELPPITVRPVARPVEPL